MAQNGPKMVVNRKFLENGSNDFSDFWPEVGGQYSKKVDPAGFFPKIPVFLDLGLTVPKRPKNLFFEIWSVYIVIIYENEALGLKKNKKIFLEFLGPPFSPKSLFWTENGQKSILGSFYHMTHHFSCPGREKIEKNVYRSF